VGKIAWVFLALVGVALAAIVYLRRKQAAGGGVGELACMFGAAYWGAGNAAAACKALGPVLDAPVKAGVDAGTKIVSAYGDAAANTIKGAGDLAGGFLRLPGKAGAAVQEFSDDAYEAAKTFGGDVYSGAKEFVGDAYDGGKAIVSAPLDLAKGVGNEVKKALPWNW
jgi:hypothetical protein